MKAEQIYDLAVGESLGFDPTSNAIKPVHVANGLARAISGHYGDVARLHEVARLKPRGRGKQEPPWSAQDCREQVPHAFADCDDETINTVRSAVSEMVTADHAVLGLPNFSSYTLSHELFATSDYRDQGLGNFIWALLKADIGTRPVALEALQGILSRQATDVSGDDLTLIVLPLLDPKRTPWSRAAPLDLRSLKHLRDRKAPSHLLGWLRVSMDQLAAREEDAPPLLLLRRLVLMACLGVHLHMVQWQAEIDPTFRLPRDFTPVLLDLSGDARSVIADASRDSFVRAMDCVDWLAQYLISEQLQRSWAGRNLDDGRVVRAILSEIEPDDVRDLYDEFRQLESPPLEALTAAVFYSGSQEKSVPPRDFARYLAQRCGLVGPRTGGRKRYRVSLELLEILTLATVPDGAVWTVRELLDAWWERFGLLVGGRDEDVELLEGHAISRLTLDDLEANGERLIELLEEQGLARRYGDGVKQIGRF